MQRIHVHLNPGSEAIPVPHVTKVEGVSDGSGRFRVWDAINKALCYDVQGTLTLDWQRLELPVAMRKRLVVRQPLRA